MTGYEEDIMIPEPDNEKKEETRKLFLANFQQRRLTDVEFIFGQIKFINKKMWVGQFAAFVLLCVFSNWYIGVDEVDYRIYSFISTITPVLFIFQIDELSKLFNRKRLELEMATRFSVKKLLLSRMIVLGMTDLFVMAGWIAGLHRISGKGYWNLLLYTSVPFNITVIGLFFLVNVVNEGYSYHFAALSYMALICGAFTVLPRWRQLLYEPDNQIWWIVMFVVSSGLCIYMIYRVWNLFSDYGSCVKLRERDIYGINN